MYINDMPKNYIIKFQIKIKVCFYDDFQDLLLIFTQPKCTFVTAESRYILVVNNDQNMAGQSIKLI